MIAAITLKSLLIGMGIGFVVGLIVATVMLLRSARVADGDENHRRFMELKRRR